MEVTKEFAPVDLDKQSVVFSKAASDHEGPVRRNAQLSDRLVTEPFADCPTLYHLFRRSVKMFGTQNCLGWREIIGDAPKEETPASGGRAPADNRPRGSYVWWSYNEVSDKVTQFGSFLRNKGFNPGDKVGLYSKNKPEWTITEHACNAHSFVTVAIYDTFGPEVIEYVINHAELKGVVSSPECVSKLVQAAPNCPSMKIIVQIGSSLADDGDEANKKAVEDAGLEFFLFEDALKQGAENHVDHAPPTGDTLAVLMYTSGTTGPPKGVMHRHSNLVATATAVAATLGGITPSDVYISYLPLAHILEREAVTAIISGGGSIGYYHGEIPKLTEDISMLRPTLMAGVPRVFDRIYSKIRDRVAKASGLQQYLFNWAYSSKKESGGKHWLWDAVVFSKFKSVLGGRMRLIVSGGAPLSAETQEFLRICFSCPVVQGYGLTETCAAGCVTLPQDAKVGHTGPPVCCAEIKLVDVDEMNYKSSNEEECGEVCIRGPCVSSGYYKDEEKTKADFDADGWFHTGDIGRWNANGTLSIIDRKKNIFKLAQGEYIAAEKLEMVFSKTPLLQQLFIYGDSYQTVLIAIAVPEKDNFEAAAKASNISYDSYEALCQNEDAKKLVLAEMTKLGKDKKLQGFEFPKGIILYSKEFSVDDDLVTPTMKLKRPQLKKKFEDDIKALYSKVADRS